MSDNSVLIGALTVLAFFASIMSIIKSEKHNHEESNDGFRIDSLAESNGMLLAQAENPSTDKAFAFNPFRVHNLNDEFILVQDYSPDSFFTTISWESLEIIEQWGEISGGPEPYEFINYPFQAFVHENRLVTFDPAAREIRQTQITESGKEIKFREDLIYFSYDGMLNRVIRLRDDLYFALHESYRSSKTNEWVAFNPAREDEMFYFGSHPGEPSADMQAWEYFDKNGVAHPNGEKMMAFYSRHNALKIFDDSGQKLDAIIFADEVSRSPEQVFPERAEQTLRMPQWADEDYIFTLKVELDELIVSSQIEIWNWEGELLFHAPLDQPVSAITASVKRGKIIGVSHEHEASLFVWDLDVDKFAR